MLILLLVGLVAGLITSLSPCVLPVLPVVLTAAVPQRTAPPPPATEEGPPGGGVAVAAPPATRPRRSWRPYGVVAGLMISFSLATLFGSLILTALHLPDNLLRIIGIVVLLVVGASFLIPPLGHLLEAPFARIRGRQVNPDSNGLVIGLGLGLLFVPCAGPVLTVIAVVGASHQFSVGALVLTAGFAVGVGVPLLILALAGESLTRRMGFLRNNAQRLRAIGGAVMIIMALLIAFNLTDGLQRLVPGYASALESNAERGASGQLDGLTQAGGQGGPATGPQAIAGCVKDSAALVDCGQAPEPAGISQWLNTPGGAPVNLAAMRGQVVLVDFWTYSCINCQRTLPHLESWARTYQNAGFQIVSIHTPEFPFEHDPSSVADQARAMGVQYPIGIDNDFTTWHEYNANWPAEFVIDKDGKIRHFTTTEGDYGATEGVIRTLLNQRNPQATLPAPTEIADTTPVAEATPETYFGYQYVPQRSTGPAPTGPAATSYTLPAAVNPDTFALGGTWSSKPQFITAGRNASMQLNFQATKVHLVAGGQGTIGVSVNGVPAAPVTVNGPATLYTPVDAAQPQRATVTLTFSPGVEAYSFTFD